MRLRALGAALILGAAVACGETLTIQPVDPSTDGGADAAGPTATRPDGSCDPSRPWTTISALADAINTPDKDEGAARLTPDELTMVFARGLGIDFQLMITTRADPGTPFPPAVPMPSLEGPDGGTEFQPTLSPDGRRIIFASARSAPVPTGGYDLFSATRNQTGDAFGAPSAIAELNTAAAEFNPFLTLDGTELWFTTTRNDGGADIYHAAIDQDGGFSPAAPVQALSTPGLNESAPTLDRDDLVILYAIADGGSPPSIAQRTRTERTGPFGGATSIDALNAPDASTMPSWLSTDRCRLYFDSDRRGTFDIYLAERSP